MFCLAVVLAACATRPPVLPPPAPAAPEEPIEIGPPPTVAATRRAEEGIERVDITALVSAMEMPTRAASAPSRSSMQRLEVRVIGESGDGLGGAHLVLENLSTGAIWRTRSGDGGRAFFAGVPPGVYRLRARLTGWAESEDLTVEMGEAAPASVELRLPRPPHQGHGTVSVDPTTA